MKSTIQTSRKIYAMKFSLGAITLIVAIYGLLTAFQDNVDSSVFVTALGSIGAIVTGLQIADGMKGHEKDDKPTP